MNQKQQVSLSRFISYVLRHHPEKFGLILDEQGFTPVKKLLAMLNKEKKLSQTIKLRDLQDIQKHLDKKRFELTKGKIRAIYGHSITSSIQYERVAPPEILFHGTTPRSVEKIVKHGLLRMERQFVHLCTNPKQAFDVGKRRNKAPVILKIAAKEAHQKGIRFFRASEDIFLVKYLPAKFIIWPKGVRRNGPYENINFANRDQNSQHR